MTALPHVAPEPPSGANRVVLRMLSTRLSCALERSLPFRLLAFGAGAGELLSLSGNNSPEVGP